MSKAQRIRDPLHGVIEFRPNPFEGVIWSTIQTSPFQRLRRIKQLGFSDLVYPGASHSRFAHSIGVFHTARRLMSIIEKHLGKDGYKDTSGYGALAAALLHDIGHGPFSHAFEDVGKRLSLKMASHETVSSLLIRDGDIRRELSALGSGFADDVANIINSKPTDIYSAVVSSQFDADRLDYVRRDRLMTGTQHGRIDYEWLVSNIEIGNVPSGVDETALRDVQTFVLGPKAIYAAEAYVLGLFQLYPTVYLHKATRGAEKIFSEILLRIITSIQNGGAGRVNLAKDHPIVRFAKYPERVENLLSLDDSCILGSLELLEKSRDNILSLFSRRLRNRKLYKAIDVRSRLQRGAEDSANDAAIVRACALIEEEIQEKLRYWAQRDPDGPPRILVDKAEREPYRSSQESKGPLNQIRIRTEAGTLADLRDESEVVRAIQTFRLFRVYVADEDEEAKRFVLGIIETGSGHG